MLAFLMVFFLLFSIFSVWIYPIYQKQKSAVQRQSLSTLDIMLNQGWVGIASNLDSDGILYCTTDDQHILLAAIAEKNNIEIHAKKLTHRTQLITGLLILLVFLGCFWIFASKTQVVPIDSAPTTQPPETPNQASGLPDTAVDSNPVQVPTQNKTIQKKQHYKKKKAVKINKANSLDATTNSDQPSDTTKNPNPIDISPDQLNAITGQN